MAYERIVNKEKREATIRMYGVIGRDIDGNQMAHDLAELDKDADTIHILINSEGGSVAQGLSIVSTILSSKSYIHAHINGIAASMAAVVAVSADKISMQDYAKLMIHDPFFAGIGKEKLSGKDIKALNSITDSLRTILARRGCDKDRIASLMKDETWFSASEAQEAGLVDEVTTTPRKEELSNLSVPELMNRIMNEYQSSNKKTNMKEIAKKLGLPENATEQQILDAIGEKDRTVNEQKQSVVDTLLAFGKKNGTVTEKNEERMKRLALADFDLFAEMISDVAEDDQEEDPDDEENLTRKPSSKAENRRLTDVINQVQKGKKSPNDGNGSRNWDWYQKNDPEALLRMEVEEPQKFNRLRNEYESSIM